MTRISGELLQTVEVAFAKFLQGIGYNDRGSLLRQLPHEKVRVFAYRKNMNFVLAEFANVYEDQ